MTTGRPPTRPGQTEAMLGGATNVGPIHHLTRSSVPESAGQLSVADIDGYHPRGACPEGASPWTRRRCAGVQVIEPGCEWMSNRSSAASSLSPGLETKRRPRARRGDEVVGWSSATTYEAHRPAAPATYTKPARITSCASACGRGAAPRPDQFSTSACRLVDGRACARRCGQARGGVEAGARTKPSRKM